MDNNKRPTILVVDDTPANLKLMAGLLKDEYRIKIANNGIKALEYAFQSPPDLILLDIMMPEMDGYEVCRQLKENRGTQHIPVIFLTAKIAIEDEEKGFELGAVDFIHKPVSPPIVSARVRAHLEVKSWHDFLQNKTNWLEQEVEQRLSQINRLQDASIYVMVSLAEFRDECTGNHIRRTQAYVRLLAEYLAKQPEYKQTLSPEHIELIAKSAPLHDIGKIAIPDHILLKPGKLTPAEFEVMKTHSMRGFDILNRAGGFMGEQGAFLSFAKDIARHHHEKWDGSGYPDGLSGHQIPLAARLMAVADVYDALRSARPYKQGVSHDQAITFISQGKGTHFDPDLVDVLLELSEKFIEISEMWPDA